jgi:hypothetical protein
MASIAFRLSCNISLPTFLDKCLVALAVPRLWIAEERVVAFGAMAAAAAAAVKILFSKRGVVGTNRQEVCHYRTFIQL